MNIKGAGLASPVEFLFRRYIRQPTPRYTIVSQEGHAGIRCHGCCKISYDPMDVKERFCSCLQVFHDFVEEVEIEGRRMYGHKDHGP